MITPAMTDQLVTMGSRTEIMYTRLLTVFCKIVYLLNI